MGGEVRRVEDLDSAGCFAGVSRMQESNGSPGCSQWLNDVAETVTVFCRRRV